MSFLHPALLAVGLGAVCIPVIIHFLFRRRRKPIVWGAMRFLLEAYRRQRRRLQLEQLILLAVRCLLVACVGAAIAHPLLDRAGLLGSGRGRTVMVVIDNSLASHVRDADGAPALARHKRSARELLDALGPGSRAGLVTLGGPAEAVVSPASADIAAVRRLVDEVQAVDSAADVAGGLRAVAASLDTGDGAPVGGSVVVSLLSDFREGSAPLGEALPAALAGLDDVLIVTPTPASRAVDNVQVVGIEPIRSVMLSGDVGGTAQQVRVRLRRFGEGVGRAGVSSVLVRALDADGRPLDAAGARGTVEWRPGQEEGEATLRVRAGLGDAGRGDVVLVASIDQDGLVSDNTARRAIGVRQALRVGVVAQRSFGRGSVDQLSAGDWLRLALRPAESVPVDVVDIEPASVDAPVLGNLDAVFVPSPQLLSGEVWGRLRRFADGGGMVVVSPPAEGGVNLWTDAFDEAFGLGWRIAREAEDVEPPVGLARGGEGDGLLSLIDGELDELLEPVTVMRVLAIEQAGEGLDAPIVMADGRAWVAVARPGSGEEGEGRGRGLVVYMASAVSLEWSGLMAKPLAVPFLQELVRQGVGRAGGASSWVAGRGVGAPAGAVRVTALEGGRSLGVMSDGRPESAIRRAGVWRGVDASGRARGLVVVNPDVVGGATGVASAEAVEDWLASAGGASSAAQVGEGFRVAMFEDGGLAEAVVNDGRGSAAALPLLIAALALALVETALARWFSHAEAEKGGRVRGGVVAGAAA